MLLSLSQAALEQPVDAAAAVAKGDAGLLNGWGCVFTTRDIRTNMMTEVPLRIPRERLLLTKPMRTSVCLTKPVETSARI